MDTVHDWKKFYRDAILETDWSKIEEDIKVAENGIRARLHEFSMNQAIADALNGLNVLRKEVAAKRAGT
jgi:hypothetical protein